MTERTFPVLPSQRDIIEGVPWSLLKKHEAQAIINHGQTLEQLARRGGLSLPEMALVLEGRDLYPGRPQMSKESAEGVIRYYLRRHNG